MRHGLSDFALLEGRIVGDLARIEHRSSRGGRTDQSHHRVLVELTRPVGHDLVDLGTPFEPCRGRAVARITDQILATHRLEQAVPMLRTGSARVDIDVVVRSAALARVDADRRLATPDGSRADAWRRLTVAAIHVGEGVAYVVHDRVLHAD